MQITQVGGCGDLFGTGLVTSHRPGDHDQGLRRSQRRQKSLGIL